MPLLNVLFRVADALENFLRPPARGQALAYASGASLVPLEHFIDVWSLSDDPAAVADWGPTVNALIAAGRRNLFFGPHDFPFSTRINAASTDHLVFQGTGGGNSVWSRGIDIVQWPGRLVWKGGAGSGIAVDAGAAVSFCVRNLQICYDSAAYDGVLVSCNNNNWGALFSHASLTSTAKTIQSAAALLSVDNTAYVEVVG
jgi:hypothetical protein